MENNNNLQTQPELNVGQTPLPAFTQAPKTDNAGFFSRMFAGIIDSLIDVNIFLIFVFVLFSFFKYEKNIAALMINAFLGLTTYILVIAVVSYLYVIFFTSYYGGTLGKLLLGLKVLDRTSNQFVTSKVAFWRGTVGKMFSSVFLGFGYFQIFRNSEKLAWHDMLFNTRVAKVGSSLPGVITFVLLLISLVFTLSMAISSVKSLELLESVNGRTNTNVQI